MGRKIPAKKHRGVKDPVLQQIKRLESLKGKINAPPKDPDDQPVPQTLTRLFAFQDKRTKSISIKKKQNQMVHNKDGSASISLKNPISTLRKLPGESGRGFSLRINNAVRALHNPAEELNYPLDIETEDVKGMRMADQRERRARKRRNTSNAHKDKHDDVTEPLLTRTQKLALKRKAKKLKAAEASEERRELVYDRVSFGEVSHAPPTLHFRSRGNSAAPRPGQRDLLLNSLLAGNDNKSNKNKKSGSSASSMAAGVPLTSAEARRRERARLDAVAAYRALKASKLK